MLSKKKSETAAKSFKLAGVRLGPLGRKSIFKLLMVNFLFHCADGTWLVECVDTTGVQK